MKLLRFASAALLAISFVACDKEHHDTHDYNKFLGVWENVSALDLSTGDTVWTPTTPAGRSFFAFYSAGKIRYKWGNDILWGTYEIKDVSDKRYELFFRNGSALHPEINGGVFGFYKEGDIVFWPESDPAIQTVTLRYKRK